LGTEKFEQNQFFIFNVV